MSVILVILLCLQLVVGRRRCPERSPRRVSSTNTCRNIAIRWNIGDANYEAVQYIDTSTERTSIICDWIRDRKSGRNFAPNDADCNKYTRMKHEDSTSNRPCIRNYRETLNAGKGYEYFSGCPFERVKLTASLEFRYGINDEGALAWIIPQYSKADELMKYTFDEVHARGYTVRTDETEIPTLFYSPPTGFDIIEIDSFAKNITLFYNSFKIQGIELGLVNGGKKAIGDTTSTTSQEATCRNENEAIVGFFNFIREPNLIDLGIHCKAVTQEDCNANYQNYEPDQKGGCRRIPCTCSNGKPSLATGNLCTVGNQEHCKSCDVGYELIDNSCKAFTNTLQCEGGSIPIPCLSLFQNRNRNNHVVNADSVSFCWSPTCDDEESIDKLKEQNITCIRATEKTYYTYPDQVLDRNSYNQSVLRDTCVDCPQGIVNATSSILFMGEFEERVCNTTHCSCPRFTDPFKCVQKELISRVPIYSVCTADCRTGWTSVQKTKAPPNNVDQYQACADENECLVTPCGFDTTNTSLNLCVNTVGSYECGLFCDPSSSLVQNGDQEYCECLSGFYPDSPSQTQKVLGIDPTAFCVSCSDLQGKSDPLCSGHGRCIPPFVAFTRPSCYCDPGYGGYLCEIPLEHRIECSADLSWECIPEPYLSPSIQSNPQLLFQNAWQCSSSNEFTLISDPPSGIELHFQKATFNEVQLYPSTDGQRWTDQELCLFLWAAAQEEAANQDFNDKVELNRNRNNAFLESVQKTTLSVLTVETRWPSQDLWSPLPSSDLQTSLWTLEKFPLCPFPFNTDVFRGNESVMFAPCSVPVQNAQEGWFFEALLAPETVSGGNAFCYLLDAFARGREMYFNTTSAFPYRCKGFISSSYTPSLFVDCVVQPPVPPHQIDLTTTPAQRGVWIKDTCLMPFN